MSENTAALTSAAPVSPLDVSLTKGSRKPLKEAAMLTALTITGWRGSKKDKKVTADVAESHHVSADAGAYWKRLIGKDAINPIQAAAQNARAIHYKYSLPWDEAGDRIIPAALFAVYRADLTDAKDRWEREVEKFLAAYASHIEKAREALNGLFNENDYPTVEDMATKFRWSLQIKPLPDAGDFRVALSDGERAKIREELEAHQQETLIEATKDVWSRLYKVVDHFRETMSSDKEKHVLHRTVVTNISDLCKVVADLNLSGDPKLTEIQKQIEDDLCALPIDDYRGNEESAKVLRKEKTAKADAILDVVSSYL